jgi:hypothetical protein
MNLHGDIAVSHSNSGNLTNLAVANEDPSIHIFPYSKAPMKQTVLGWEWWAVKTSNVVFVGLWERINANVLSGPSKAACKMWSPGSRECIWMGAPSSSRIQ